MYSSNLKDTGTQKSVIYFHDKKRAFIVLKTLNFIFISSIFKKKNVKIVTFHSNYAVC